MKTWLLALLVLFVWGCGDGAEEPAPEGETLTQAINPCPAPPLLDIGDNPVQTLTASTGDQFDYYVYVPTGYDHCHKDHPIVFVFHGANQTASYFHDPANLKFMELLRDEADDKDMVLVWLDSGTPEKKWNSGYSGTVDHLAAVDELLTHLNGELNLAQKYALGFSNGGAFAQYLAAERSSTFSAVASIAGYAGVYANPTVPPLPCWLDWENPACGWMFETVLGPAPLPPGPRDINIMMVRGEQDNVIPVDGASLAGAIVASVLTGGLIVFTPAIHNPANIDHSDYEIWKAQTGCTLLTTKNFPGRGDRYLCRGGSGTVRHDIVTNMGHFVPTNDPTDGNYAEYDGPGQVMRFFWNHP